MSDLARLSDLMEQLRETGATASQLVIVTNIIATCLSTPKGAALSDAERAKRYRERHASRDGVTDDGEENPPKEKNQTPLSPETLRVSTPKRGTRLPTDWHPSENLWTWGKAKLGLSEETLRFETGAFRDHFWGVSGAKGVKLDWDATWKNWMREALRRHKRTAKKDNVLEYRPRGPVRTYAEIKAERESQ